MNKNMIMKRIQHITLTLLMILFSLISYDLRSENHALIIAIGDYPDDKGWTDISSTNDIVHVKHALGVLGFSDQNITVIKDQEATRENILAHFKELTNKLSKGDHVYIHYSGHGQQVMDDNNDEIDLLDESIVPFDSPMEYKEGVNEGQFLIRDDEIGKIILKIRTKLGQEGQVFLVMDSCHSGTGTRSIGKARGTDRIMAPKNFKLLKSKETFMSLSPEQTNNIAKCISFFGSSAKELNFETLDEERNPVGSLSYALSSVLAQAPENMTYEDIFYLVRLKMKKLAPMQNPQWEGPRNTLLFGNRKKGDDPSYQINKIINNHSIEISAGTLAGIYKDSRVEVIDAISGSFFAQGVIKKSNLSNAFAGLNNEKDFDDKSLYKVIIKEYSHPRLFINLISNIDNGSTWKSLNDEVIGLPYVQTCEDNPDIVIEESSKGTLALSSKNGEEILRISAQNDNSFSEIKAALRTFLQAQFLRSYAHFNPRLNCSISIVQVDPDTEKEIAILDDNCDIKVGSCIKFRIKNEGISGAYVSVLDIQPDNIVNLIVPPVHLGYKAEEYYVKAGDSLTTNFIIEIGDPLGEETLLLLASKTPLELEGMISNNGRTKRSLGELSSFEQQFSESFGTVQRRGLSSRKQKEKLSSKTLFFNIVEK